MKRNGSLMAIVCCTALWSGTAHADPLYPEADFQLTQSSTSVVVDQSLTVQGGGAKPGSDFVIFCDTVAQPTGGGEQQVANGVVEGDGTFTVTFSVPTELTPGVYKCRVVTTISTEAPAGLTKSRTTGSRPAALADEVRQQGFQFVVVGEALPRTGQDSGNSLRIALGVTVAGVAAAMLAFRRRRNAAA